MAKKKKKSKKKVVVCRERVMPAKATKKKKSKQKKVVTARNRIGSFGGIVFQVYATGSGKNKKALMPAEMKQEISSEWSEHKRIGYKSKPEFNASGIRTFALTVMVDVQLGYKPHAIMKKFHKMCEEGKVFPLYIGTHKIGKYKWKLESVSDAFDLMYSGGELARVLIDLTLSEYC